MSDFGLKAAKREADRRRDAARAAAEEPRRLTPTERLHEVTMAAMHRAASPPEHSASAARNARGVWQLDATVRGYDLDDVLDKVIAAAAKLDAAYPYSVTNGGTE